MICREGGREGEREREVRRGREKGEKKERVNLKYIHHISLRIRPQVGILKHSDKKWEKAKRVQSCLLVKQVVIRKNNMKTVEKVEWHAGIAIVGKD